MKTPHLLASFAVAVTLSAADPKDPVAVAREWNEATFQSPDPLTHDLSLKGQTAPAPRVPAPPIALFEPRSRGRTSAPAPRDGTRLPESLYDAPNYRVLEELPNVRPRGAVPWEYNGQIYWLVPLSPPGRE